MAKRFTDTVLVTDVSRKCTSSYGNPSYWVKVASTKDGIGFRGHTASNAQCGYIVSDLVDKKCKIEYHYSQKGTLIIDTMEEVCKYGY